MTEHKIDEHDHPRSVPARPGSASPTAARRDVPRRGRRARAQQLWPTAWDNLALPAAPSPRGPRRRSSGRRCANSAPSRCSSATCEGRARARCSGALRRRRRRRDAAPSPRRLRPRRRTPPAAREGGRADRASRRRSPRARGARPRTAGRSDATGPPQMKLARRMLPQGYQFRLLGGPAAEAAHPAWRTGSPRD